MDIKTFTDDLLQALSEANIFTSVSVQSEGPTIDGHAWIEENTFLRIYYNAATGTQAFALIRNNQRFWGIDYDNFRGWHEHPVSNPAKHITIEPITVKEIIHRNPYSPENI